MKPIILSAFLGLLISPFFSHSVGNHAIAQHGGHEHSHGGVDFEDHSDFDPGSVIGTLQVILSNPNNNTHYEREGQITDKGFVLANLRGLVGSIYRPPFFNLSIQINSVEISDGGGIFPFLFNGMDIIEPIYNKEAVEQAIATAQEEYEKAVERQKKAEISVRLAYIALPPGCPSSLTVKKAMILVRANESREQAIKARIPVDTVGDAVGGEALSKARDEELTRIIEMDSEESTKFYLLYQHYGCLMDPKIHADDVTLLKVGTEALEAAEIRKQKYTSWELAVKILQEITRFSNFWRSRP